MMFDRPADLMAAIKDCPARMGAHDAEALIAGKWRSAKAIGRYSSIRWGFVGGHFV